MTLSFSTIVFPSSFYFIATVHCLVIFLLWGSRLWSSVAKFTDPRPDTLFWTRRSSLSNEDALASFVCSSAVMLFLRRVTILLYQIRSIEVIRFCNSISFVVKIICFCVILWSFSTMVPFNLITCVSLIDLSLLLRSLETAYQKSCFK